MVIILHKDVLFGLGSLNYDVKHVINDLNKYVENVEQLSKCFKDIRSVNCYATADFDLDEHCVWFASVKQEFVDKNGNKVYYDTLYQSVIGREITPDEVFDKVCRLAEDYKCEVRFNPSMWERRDGKYCVEWWRKE